MRNRAKCRLCKSELESVALMDYMECTCGEIGISGGVDKLNCFAKDFTNFIRLDDEGKEVEVKVIDKAQDKEEVPVTEEIKQEMTREDKIKLVNAMLDYYENLPQHAMLSAPTQYDLKAVYVLIRDCLT